MLNTTTRKVGNSIMVSIPAELSPAVNQKYVITKMKNGTIIMTPKLANPYKSSQKFVSDSNDKVFEMEAWKELKNDN